MPDWLAGWLDGWMDDAESRIQELSPDRAPCFSATRSSEGSPSSSSSSLPCERPKDEWPGLSTPDYTCPVLGPPVTTPPQLDRPAKPPNHHEAGFPPLVGSRMQTAQNLNTSHIAYMYAYTLTTSLARVIGELSARGSQRCVPLPWTTSPLLERA
ncbi:uncharacterized protein LY79DRAFT_535383 [Colletotrichum navitas]|uniref:Uncharacterized protein n=1 Tax=Colletotrichum navitas TaxID=681940 RepID=A0AAD8QDL2_9PEZI|nr:uncharacterized protein LY79DRAFT_535383 [Colletotrichum navitas]KAK1599532.1 hypothetical protein LY79DRAFT_535383 [Colletotrichum navitas]